MLNGLDVDLLFTGELSHHEALAAIEKGTCVITTLHSNSERLYLQTTMHRKLYAEIRRQIQEMDATSNWEAALTREFQVDSSRADRDPFEIVTKWDDW